MQKNLENYTNTHDAKEIVIFTKDTLSCSEVSCMLLMSLVQVYDLEKTSGGMLKFAGIIFLFEVMVALWESFMWGLAKRVSAYIRIYSFYLLKIVISIEITIEQ